MTLHLITLTISFTKYKWSDTALQVQEKENAFVVTDDNDMDIMKLVPDVIAKNRINVILVPKLDSVKQISLAMYCQGRDIIETKDKLITEIRQLSEAFIKGFEEQKKMLETLTYENL